MKFKATQKSLETFGDLYGGDIFRVATGSTVFSSIFMKVEEAYNEGDARLNAVDTSDGEQCWFADKELVEKVSGVFVEGYDDED